MHKPQFYVSGKRPIDWDPPQVKSFRYSVSHLSPLLSTKVSSYTSHIPKQGALIRLLERSCFRTQLLAVRKGSWSGKPDIWRVSLIKINLWYKRHQIPKLKCFSSRLWRLSCLCPNPMKPGVKSTTKMQLAQGLKAKLQLHLSIQQVYCLPMCDLY